MFCASAPKYNPPPADQVLPKRFRLAVCLALGLYGLWVGQDYIQGKLWEANIHRVFATSDANGNGINDTDDIIAGARQEVRHGPFYKSAYYEGGYPPASEGVCTDVVWRALQHAGYNLKDLMDTDISRDVAAYPRTGGKPDPNIDFRRVPNQRAFFQRHAEVLTTDLILNDANNLAQWQPGDIVSFSNPDHVAILSTRRNASGIPYLIHNQGPRPREKDDFMNRRQNLNGHYRFPGSKKPGK